MMKRGFIFDMDGTMVDNMAFHRLAMVEFFRRQGRPLDETGILAATGRRDVDILAEHFPALSASARSALEVEWENIFWHLYGPYRRLVPGLAELIDRAVESGIACAVASSASRASIHWTLDDFPIARHLGAIVSAADVRNGKPAPDVFLEAAARCQVRPEHCVVFEDAPAGVEAAGRAGMRAVALTTSFPAHVFTKFDNVIAVARNFEELAQGFPFDR